MNSDYKAAAGINFVRMIIENDFRWIFREQPYRDRGVDAEIELQNVVQVGRVLKTQVKNGPSYFNRRGDGEVRVTFEKLAYWHTLGLPVLMIACDDEQNLCYWQVIANETVRDTPKGSIIIVPRTQRLDMAARLTLQEIAAKTETQLSENRLREIGNPFRIYPSWDSDFDLEIDSGTVHTVTALEATMSAGQYNVAERVKIGTDVQLYFEALRQRFDYRIPDPRFDAASGDEVSIISTVRKSNDKAVVVAAVNYSKIGATWVFLAAAWASLYPVHEWIVRGAAVTVTGAALATWFAWHNVFASAALVVALLYGSYRVLRRRHTPTIPEAEAVLKGVLERLQANEFP